MLLLRSFVVLVDGYGEDGGRGGVLFADHCYACAAVYAEGI